MSKFDKTKEELMQELQELTSKYESLKIEYKRNFTERKQTKNMLTLAQYSINNVYDAIYWVDENAKIHFVNDTVYKQLGYSEKEIKEMTVFDIDPVFPKEEWGNHWNEINKNGTTTIESCHKTKNGLIFPVEIKTNCIKFGKKTFNCAIVRDITERKIKEEELKQSEELYKSMLQILPDGVLIHTNGKIVYANEVACKIVKAQSPDEIIGKLLADFIHPDSKEQWQIRQSEIHQSNRKANVIEGKIIALDNDVIDIASSAISFNYYGNLSVLSVFNDISERKSIEKALVENEKKYRLLTENMKDLIWEINNDYKVNYISPSVEMMSGFKQDEVVGKYFIEFIEPAFVNFLIERFKTRIENYLKYGLNENIILEFKQLCKDGTYIWVEAQSNLVFDDSGNLTGLQGVTRKINERKHNEELIKLLKHSIDVHSDAIFWMDSDNKFIYFNETGYKSLGYNYEELKSMSLNQINRYATKEALENVWKKLRKEGHYTSESIHIRKDGSEFPVEIRSNYVKFKEKEYNLGFAHDITERKKAERELRESEERFRLILENMPILLNAFDENGNFIVWNKACEIVTGYSTQEIIGNPKAMELLYPNEEYRMEVWNSSINKNNKDNIYNLVAKNTEIKTIEWFDIYHDLKIPGWTSWGIGYDITERKRAEEALQKSEELYRKLLMTVPEVIVQTDINGNIVFVNETAFPSLGIVPKDRFYGKNMLSFIAEKDLDRAVFNTKLMFEKPLGVQEYLMRFDDGIEFYVEVIGEVLRDASENPYGMVYVVRDVSEQKLIQEQIRKSENLYRLLAENIDDVIWKIDFKTLKFTYISPSVNKLRGLTVEEAMNESLEDSLHPDSYNFVMKVLKDNLDNLSNGIINNANNIFELKQYKKDKSIIFIEVVASFILNENGGIQEILGVSRDISARKKAEESIIESEHRLHLATSAGKIGVWDWDIENNILVWDESMYLLYGIEPENFNGAYEAWSSTLHPDDRLYADGEIQAALRGEREYEPEFRIVRTDNEIRTIKSKSHTFRNQEGKAIRMVGTNIDITEQKLAEESLKNSESKLKEAQRMARIGNWELNIINNELIWSEEVFNIFEISPDTFDSTYEAFINSIHPDDTEIVNQTYLKSLENRLPYSITHRLLMPDGRVKFVYQQCETNYNIYGQPYLSVGTVQDITHIKEVEEALKISEKKIRALLDQTFQFIGMLDIQGNLLDANRTALQFLNLKINDVIGKPYWETPWWTHSEAMQCNIRDAIKKAVQGETVFFEATHLSLENKLRIIDFSLKPVFDNNKNVIFLIPEGHDITEQKIAEEALSESELYYRTLFESANDAIFLMRKDKFTDCNKKVLELFKCTRNQIIGLPPYQFSPPVQPDGKDSREKAMEKIHNTLAGTPQFFEWVHKKYDGNLFDAEVSLNRIEKNGNYEIQAIVRDVSERKKAEIELLQYREKLEDLVKERTAQLETVNKELEAFSYSVSHDLRAPLRSIDGFSNALLEDYLDILDEQGKDFLNRIRNSTQTMGNLIDSLLSLSRLSRSDIHYEKINLSKLVEKIINDIKAIDSERNVEIIIKPNLHVNADLRLMEILLTNLLKNAWKFSSHVLNSVIEFGEFEKNGEKAFFIRDNGAGFNMAYINKLFSPFQRLHTLDEFEGNGIGLATVKRIVNKHGGNIWAYSEIDNGATFYFTLKPINI